MVVDLIVYLGIYVRYQAIFLLITKESLMNIISKFYLIYAFMLINSASTSPDSGYLGSTFRV